MAWRKCATRGCARRVREGLRRHGAGAAGQDLADGRYCWLCRQTARREEKKSENQQKRREREERRAEERWP